MFASLNVRGGRGRRLCMRKCYDAIGRSRANLGTVTGVGRVGKFIFSGRGRVAFLVGLV